MHEAPLLIDITVALVAAFAGGVLARRIGLPTIVGYLLAGIVIGPFTPGFVGDVGTITQLADLGVIFLMFGVGLHFSLSDLWQVRGVAMRGAPLQIAVATLAGFALTRLWGWTPSSGLMFGLSISVASTVVLLRALMDHSLLTTRDGKVAIGWLVVEDLATILILVLLPVLTGGDGGADWGRLGIKLASVVAFVAVMLFAGTRLIPLVLSSLARSRSRELFILAILAIALGIALAAAEMLGVSLALGAFVAGVVISESPVSHQVGADVLPFREAFAVLFFVSVGMLVDPAYLMNNLTTVLLVAGLIMIAKPLWTFVISLVLARSARTALITAAGLSQMGEFSFVMGQSGVSLGLLTQDQYSLILAGAIITITVNPLAFRLVAPVEAWLRTRSGLWNRMHGDRKPAALPAEVLHDHLVIVGYGRVGSHLVNVARELDIPHLVIESDAEKVDSLTRRGTPTLWGDAANSEILRFAGLERARAFITTLPEEAGAEMVVAAARQMNRELPIVARAATEVGVGRLAELGAQDVIHPELEGGLEIVTRAMLRLGFPLREVLRYVDAVRHDRYEIEVNSDEEHQLLHDLLDSVDSMDITWLRLPDESDLLGKTLVEADLRNRTGASVVAMTRDGKLLANPKSFTVFERGDRIGVIGEPAHLEAIAELVSSSVRPKMHPDNPGAADHDRGTPRPGTTS